MKLQAHEMSESKTKQLRFAYELLQTAEPSDALTEWNRRMWIRWRDEWIENYENELQINSVESAV